MTLNLVDNDAYASVKLILPSLAPHLFMLIFMGSIPAAKTIYPDIVSGFTSKEKKYG
jgi:hypothetical protein